MFNRGSDLESKVRFLDDQLTQLSQDLVNLSSRTSILDEAEIPVINDQILNVKVAIDQVQRNLNDYINAQQKMNAEAFGMLFAFRDIILKTELADESELEKAVSYFKGQFDKNNN